MTVSDNTVQAEGLSNFLTVLGKKALKVSKEMAKKLLKILDELLKPEQTLVLH